MIDIISWILITYLLVGYAVMYWVTNEWGDYNPLPDLNQFVAAFIVGVWFWLPLFFVWLVKRRKGT